MDEAAQWQAFIGNKINICFAGIVDQSPKSFSYFYLEPLSTPGCILVADPPETPTYIGVKFLFNPVRRVVFLRFPMITSRKPFVIPKLTANLRTYVA